MKIRPANADPKALNSKKGAFTILAKKQGFVVQKWPKKRGRPKTPYDNYKQTEFGQVARMASNPFWLDQQTAEIMVRGTEYVPRDFLMMCAFGKAYILEGPDGQVWSSLRDVTINPQLSLDMITTTVGSMLYRADAGWIGFAGGLNGQLLAMGANQPQWIDPPSGAGAVPPSTLLRATANETPVVATNHIVTYGAADRDDLGIWDPANPTHIITPTAFSHCRYTINTKTQSFSSNARCYCRLVDTAGNPLSPIPIGSTFSVVTNSTEKFASLSSPWLDTTLLPAYVRVFWTLETSLSWGLALGSTIQIEGANL